jgi:hypothetical protein
MKNSSVIDPGGPAGAFATMLLGVPSAGCIKVETDRPGMDGTAPSPALANRFESFIASTTKTAPRIPHKGDEHPHNVFG